MNTSERYNLYIDNRGEIILGGLDGWYNMGDAPAAAEELAEFISRKQADVLFDDYGYGFHPEFFVGKIDLANMAAGDIVAPVYAAYDKIIHHRRLLPGWLEVVAYDFAFYTRAAMAGEGYKVIDMDSIYLPYLVNGDGTGLSEADLIVAEAFDSELEVIAWNYEPDCYGRQDVLCRIK